MYAHFCSNGFHTQTDWSSVLTPRRPDYKEPGASDAILYGPNDGTWHLTNAILNADCLSCVKKGVNRATWLTFPCDINDTIRRTMERDQPIISSIFSHLAGRRGCSQSKHTIRQGVAAKGRMFLVCSTTARLCVCVYKHRETERDRVECVMSRNRSISELNLLSKVGSNFAV